MATKRRIAKILFILMLVTVVSGSFCVQDSYAAYGDGLIHAPAFDNYTKHYGIDVSSYQGTINWQAVAASGIEFAFIRVGCRGYGYGDLKEDVMARTNLIGAMNAGLKVGAYIYTQALNSDEIAAEADLVINVLQSCGIGPGGLALPVMLDVEFGTNGDGRLANAYYNGSMNMAARTQLTLEFLDRIAAAGYAGGLYSYASLLNWHDMSQIAARYQVWIASVRQQCGYYGYYNYWQYSWYGQIPGIAGSVDLDVWYDPTPPAGSAPVVSTPAPAESTDTKTETPAQSTDSLKASVADTKTTTDTKKSDTTKQVTTGKTTQTQAAPASGWHYVNGVPFYLDASTGKDLIGVHNIGGNVYYFSDTGALQFGWQELDGRKYYFGDWGTMYFGWRNIEGNWFLFDHYNGFMVSDTWVDGYRIGSNGVRGVYYKDMRKTTEDNISEVEVSNENLITDAPVFENGTEYNIYSDYYMR